MQTLLIPIIPQLPVLLDAPASDTAWVITATLLSGAVAVPTMGRLGDMFGKRRMLIVSLGLLVIGSVIGALSDSVVPMIVGRAIQGLSAGVIPLGISLMRDVLPARKLPGSMALMSASLGVGGALGLPAAALIAEYADWHVLFWAAAALGVGVTVLVVLVIPDPNTSSGGTFDFGGAVALSVALLALLLAISKGSAWGWTSTPTITLCVIAVVSCAFWAWWELRVAQPLVDLRVSAGRQVLFTNLASIAFGFAMFANALVIPQVLQLPESTGFGLGQSMLAAGLVMAPSGLVMMSVAPVSSKITTTKGPKVTLMAGAVLVAVGYGAGVFMMGEVWQLVLVSSVIGAGTGLAYGAMPALIMGTVPASETAAANSFNTLMRALGISFASAIIGVILAQMTVAGGSGSIPSEGAFRLAMGIAGGAAVVALALASFLPKFEGVSGSRAGSPVEPQELTRISREV
ncbi:MFS transporter [Rhodococcus fascians]|nr:MFS transporter [Rhodococcus fascians]MBY4140945.1 MFS transporter [Rhodococcus fascians]MBY4219609.1 MFS transporter [Rhodococcus fascians]MBY4221918.1 MFS transporter [Rhodococcus fascians]MBY4233919.1 MFS transporter [Rhodococcus fascians]